MSRLFILDENVPADVIDVLKEAGYFAEFILVHVARGSSDPVVAAETERRGGVLVTGDSDFKELVSRASTGQRQRYRRLSTVRFKCDKPRYVERLKIALGFIEFELQRAETDRDSRAIIVIGKATITTHR